MSSIASSAIGSLLSGRDNLLRIATLLIGYFLGPYFGFLPTNQNLLALGASVMFMPTALRAASFANKKMIQMMSGTIDTLAIKAENTFTENQFIGLSTAIAAACALYLMYTQSLIPTVVIDGIKTLLTSAATTTQGALEMAQSALSYCFGLIGINGDFSWIAKTIKDFLNSYGFDKVFNSTIPTSTWTKIYDLFGIATSSYVGVGVGAGIGALGVGAGALGVLVGAPISAAILGGGAILGGAVGGSMNFIFKLGTDVASDIDPSFIFVAIARIMSMGQSTSIAEQFLILKTQFAAQIAALAAAAPGSEAAAAALAYIRSATDVAAVMINEQIPNVVKIFAAIKVWIMDASSFVMSQAAGLVGAGNLPLVAAGLAFVIASIGAVWYVKKMYNKRQNVKTPTKIPSVCLDDFKQVAFASGNLIHECLLTVGQLPGINIGSMGNQLFNVASEGIKNSREECRAFVEQIMTRFKQLGQTALAVQNKKETFFNFLGQFKKVLVDTRDDLKHQELLMKEDADLDSIDYLSRVMEPVEFGLVEDLGLLNDLLKNGKKIVVERRAMLDQTESILSRGTIASKGKIVNQRLTSKTRLPQRTMATRRSVKSIKRAIKTVSKKKRSSR